MIHIGCFNKCQALIWYNKLMERSHHQNKNSDQDIGSQNFLPNHDDGQFVKKRSNDKNAFLALLLVIVTGLLGHLALMNLKIKAPKAIPITAPPAEETEVDTSVEIRYQEDYSDAYEIDYPQLIGNMQIIEQANDFITELVSDTKEVANRDRIESVAEFGSLPTYLQNPYVLDIQAEYISSLELESLVLSTYSYFGGANGTGTFKVFSMRGGKVIDSLEDISNRSNIKEFEKYIQEYLNQYSFNEDTIGADILFQDELSNVTLDTITDLAVDDINLYLYFSEYQIGPGVLGAQKIEIPLSKLANYLVF